MENSKFTYVIEPLNNKGFIDVQEGERKYKSERLLYFTKENELIEALKKYKKGAVVVYDDTKSLLTEGSRLAKKLNLEFQHP